MLIALQWAALALPVLIVLGLMIVVRHMENKDRRQIQQQLDELYGEDE